MSAVQYVIARTPDDIDAVRGLFMEYGASLDFDLCFQGFDEKLATLPGKYAAPSGCLYLMRCQNGDAVGCVGVRPLAEAGCAEMKRLYVRDNWRGDGLGRELAHRAISFAREAGYSTLRLDIHCPIRWCGRMRCIGDWGLFQLRPIMITRWRVRPITDCP